MTFVFGLVHGLGFADALEPLALSGWPLARAARGCNLGVELGQAAAIAVALPAISALGRLLRSVAVERYARWRSPRPAPGGGPAGLLRVTITAAPCGDLDMSDELPTAARVSDPGIRALYRLENRWQAWLDVEAALAQAQAELGIIPAARPRRSPRAARLELLDRERIDEGFARTGHTIVPLVWELSRVVGEPHGGWVHWGATTQNITQTGDLLVLRQAHGVFLRLIGEALAAAGRSRRARRRHADRRPHARPARGAGDVRL